MFVNLRISIFVFYFLTVIAFLAISYYFLDVLGVSNFYIYSIVLLCIIILSGIFISKLAIDPLAEYVTNLQNLSKETLHELNLPISTIMTNTQMIKKNLEDEKALKRIGRIESACDMLKQRYNELDYLIKMQSKQNVKEMIELSDLVRERITFLERIYPNKNFNLNLENLSIEIDRVGLSKVIDNLIDNGVKYSQKSQDIDINLQKKTLTIQDYGIGMDEVELLQIYDNFYQSNKHMQGFGIGLSMVKRFCDENKIELSVTSKPTQGTKVSLEF
ncbi:sensor histidine kinase [Sulfurimonas marina]|uniref:histidine kinase n=1 Tax=Sulfurimonas marina TaxID=2590551 RepID=A0A7M1AYS1_9BACT|nr:HAMP domain-containing sensor histidine kinase [Sulfurimonas marina]QOP41708.1 HAMP domain-containing histidine kinase [Sulfurimonas marina]